VLAPDKFVVDPFNAQSYNRYSYGLNNPLRFVDPTGDKLKWWQWGLVGLGASSFLLDPATAFASAGITCASAAPTLGMAAGTAQSIDFAVAVYGSIFRKDGYEWSEKRFTNYARIVGGMFQTDENKNFWGNTWLLFSRWTWESPQTFAGVTYSHLRNLSGRVDRVDYLGGATFVTDENSTGIDTLIRIDGYYYREESTGLGGPFMVSNNGEIQIFHAILKDHNRIQENFKNEKSHRGRGNYILLGDTIKVRWALPFQTGCYTIFSEQYVIIDETTLKRIWSLCENCDPPNAKKRDPVRNEIYTFYEYQIETE
jgi:hypothetical protein